MTINKYEVIPGAESFYIKGNEIGILLIHGFVGTPQSVKFVGNHLAEKGFTVYAPRLKGHGTHSDELVETTFQDWLTELEHAYDKLKSTCSHVFIAGQSMGGVLSLILANKVNPAGVITINAAFSVPGYELYKEAHDFDYVQEGKPDIKDDSIIEITYPAVPVHAIKQLLTVIKIGKENLSRVTSPLLLFKSLDDHVVPAESTNYVYHNVSSWSKKIVELTNSYHVATMDFDKFNIVEYTEGFIRKTVINALSGYKVS
ncbi:alpha/beta hydrolase [Schinkia azotoformans]|uniref:alpha/beta hydrolase n=1 Tax=Schinkia azotoformans TaxID=1454 RepID=UPI002DBA66B0|nr:alpha/beta fold hydrolase [Schinkia azotoformans]MEC1717641.1 alpha/beta fold hydrolase [Schinkia azotoformans]MEC1742038.1 alpha/beta fold hydrolase [Schinkia azotoformans]MEC1747369.1 alpha/beta fold hydrolase [Schinkia azotoformans]MEC1758279.1 alpha/beta fold hydrolase [Schinkia azotoformans]MEC1766320.1 alpha/beta fold hydrolase [Schinkia azotoformans]